ncbi:MAG: hypothetical protein ACM3RX_00090 [Methanococcaceae archaeon]
MKTLLITVLILFSAYTFAESLPAEKARGIFLAIGVGPRMPIGQFGNSSDLGYGANIELAYTDNEYLPLFLFAKAGFETFPGSQSLYQQSDYSNLSTNAIPVSLGARYYFKPLVESIVLIIPIVEASVQLNYFMKLNQFKTSSGRSNYNEENSKLGFNVGAGFSMFMLEILASYNFFQTNQYLGFDLKVRLPLYINL